MREMVLNHASLASSDLPSFLLWLSGIAQGMSELVTRRVVSNSLRASVPLEEIQCLPGVSFTQAIGLLRSSARDEALFLLRLSTNAPLVAGLDPLTAALFHLSEEVHPLPPDDGKPLLLCAMRNWVAVSFPSVSNWEQDHILVTFHELLSNGSLEETSKAIDNLACKSHAEPIIERHIIHLRTCVSSPDELWMQREALFPHLVFGLDVEGQLRTQHTALSTIIERLGRLDNDAASWEKEGGPAPSWSLNVSRESVQTMSNPRLSAMRNFRAHDGTHKIFEWHAKFGGMRIHFILNTTSRTIEVGYIGPHLPI